jgi:hypothetical protein
LTCNTCPGIRPPNTGGAATIFTIEFWQWASDDLTDYDVKVIHQHSGDFANLRAAEAYGLANTGIPGSPEEAHGFRALSSDGSRSSDCTIKIRTLKVQPAT